MIIRSPKKKRTTNKISIADYQDERRIFVQICNQIQIEFEKSALGDESFGFQPKQTASCTLLAFIVRGAKTSSRYKIQQELVSC